MMEDNNGSSKLKGMKISRREAVGLLGHIAVVVAVAPGCDLSSLEITRVDVDWPTWPRNFLRNPNLSFKFMVGFRLNGASSSPLKSATLIGTLAEVEFAKATGKVQGSTITFHVNLRVTKGRVRRALQNALDERNARASIKLEAEIDGPFGRMTVKDQWSGDVV